MAKSPKTDDIEDAVILEEPTDDEPQQKDKTSSFARRDTWMRGLYMVILAILFAVAETVLAVGAVIQFLWLLFAGEKNKWISDFGSSLAKWLAEVARFQTGSTEEKPFPWKPWS